ncbi:hypothetical protein LINPERHAP2_LOCUS19211 [Linum perenne]
MAPLCSKPVVTMHVSVLRLIFINHFSQTIGYIAEYVESSMRVYIRYVSRVGGMPIRTSHARHISVKRKIRRLSRIGHLIIRSSTRMRLDRR